MSADPDFVSRIDALLPQTQCRQCGFPGCRPYAEAIATGRAGINQCPPGGDDGVRELAALLGAAYEPLDPNRGAAKPPAVAIIEEALCIGCTLCIQACPVDAIVGAAKLMHTIVARDCTGCELCLPPCPVDCIRMEETGARPSRDERRLAADHARERFARHGQRLAGDQHRARGARTAEMSVKEITVQRAVARARQRLARGKT